MLEYYQIVLLIIMIKLYHLKLMLEEGEQYTFGDITFIGNTVYSDQT